MKKKIILLISSLCLFSLIGCENQKVGSSVAIGGADGPTSIFIAEPKKVSEISEGNNSEANEISKDIKCLLDKASPQTSAMAFYYFDGKNTVIKRLYDQAEEQRIIDEINMLNITPVEKTKVSEMKVPCYGLEISDIDGYEIWLTYSNGLWLLKSGDVYEAKYDFDSLYSDIPDDDSTISLGGMSMINSAILGQYDTRYYSKSENLENTKEGITLSFVSYENNIVTVKLQNDSDEDFFYGMYFTLQKEIDGVWYSLPVRLSNYAFEDIGLILPAGQNSEETCDLTMYGDLDSGHYRIEKEGMATDFLISDIVGESDENLDVEYIEDNSGQYIVEGDMVFQYKLVLEGQSHSAMYPTRYVVLTNNPELTWEQVDKSLYSSNSKAWLSDTIIIGMKVLK